MIGEKEKDDLQTIKDMAAKIKLVLINSQNQNLFLKLEAFCEELKRHLSELEIAYAQEDLPAYPAIKVTSKNREINLYYFCLPEGREWLPFFKALKAIARKEVFLDKGHIEKVKKLAHPVVVKVFITPHCVFCPLVVDLINQVAIANELIKVFVIDGTLYPELAKQYKVTASPTVVINEDYFLVGTEARERLIDWLEKAEQSVYDPQVIKSLLKQAQAERVVELCLENEAYLKPLLALLTDQELFPRIGAMRVLEELRDKAPQLIEKVLPQLLEMLNTQETRDKGDILFLLGLIGSPEVIGSLEEIAQREEGEIKEIALEAIEEIRQRYKFC